MEESGSWEEGNKSHICSVESLLCHCIRLSSNTTEFYDLDGSFTPGPSLPFRYDDGCLVEIGRNKIMLIGGTRNGAVVYDVTLYDLVEDTFQVCFAHLRSSDVTEGTSRIVFFSEVTVALSEVKCSLQADQR